jgi:hypothetical protein
MHSDSGQERRITEGTAAHTARERDNVQGGATACPAQVGQTSMKLSSSLDSAMRDQS